MEFREMMQGHLALRGNAFARIYANSRGEVTDLIPIHPDRITIEMLSDTNWRYRVWSKDGTDTPVRREDIFHIKGLSPNGVIGYNPIQLARVAIGTGLAAQDYGMRFFENDARPGGWIEYPGQFKDDEQRRKWRAQWQEQQTGRNRHKAAVLEFGMKYHELSVSNDDAQFIETKKMSRAEIAAMFRVPLHMIGDLDRATFSNIEQQSLEFIRDALRSWLVRWEEAIKFNFMDPEDDELHIKFDVKELMRGDSAARSQYYHNGILDGWLTRNEVRIEEDRDPLDGLDEPLRPLNMVEESEAEDDEEGLLEGDDAASKPMQPRQKDGSAQRLGGRLVALASAAAERIARKEAEMVAKALKQSSPWSTVAAAFEKHETFIVAALGIEASRAKDYCQSQLTALAGDDVDQDTYVAIARQKLESLAIKGSL
jgi:HK97 family phage portal protein